MSYEHSLIASLSPEEISVFCEKLGGFFSVYAKKFAMGDTSVRMETAQDLFSSLMFILSTHLTAEKLPVSSLLKTDLDCALRNGQNVLERKKSSARELYSSVCLNAPEIISESLITTLRGIGKFFDRYDIFFMAHLVPCDIDYQLMLPVSESLFGIDYINEYLLRLSFENELIKCFNVEKVTRLLKAACPYYSTLIGNLCEPVLANALCLNLTCGDIFSLQVENADITVIKQKFNGFSMDDIRQAIISSSGNLFDRLSLSFECRAYLEEAAAALAPRVHMAVSSGGLSGIFTSFE